MRQLKKKLYRLKHELQETNDIRIQSSKILNFLVNDILDFAQLKSSKFRKNEKNFDLS